LGARGGVPVCWWWWWYYFPIISLQIILSGKLSKDFVYRSARDSGKEGLFYRNWWLPTGPALSHQFIAYSTNILHELWTSNWTFLGQIYISFCIFFPIEEELYPLLLGASIEKNLHPLMLSIKVLKIACCKIKQKWHHSL
jgi:hypothetical protein